MDDLNEYRQESSDGNAAPEKSLSDIPGETPLYKPENEPGEAKAADGSGETDENSGVLKSVYEWVETLVTATVFIVLLFTFFLRLVGVDGTSMLPTLDEGDTLAITGFMYMPQRGDIVVITKPLEANMLLFGDDKLHPLVKRVIALGGDSISINYDTNTVYVNGDPIDEPYIRRTGDSEADPMVSPNGGNMEEMTVPDGYIFVVGDNRNHSTDSRSHYVGLVDERYVLGKCLFRLFPLKHMGTVK